MRNKYCTRDETPKSLSLQIIYFLFAYWVNFHAFLSFADFFFQNQSFQIYFSNAISVLNRVGPDQARHLV